MAEVAKSLLEQLREQRQTLIDEAASAIDARTAERSTFEARSDATPEETSTFAAAEQSFGEAHDARMGEIRNLDRRVDEQELVERRRQDAANASSPSMTITSEPKTYERHNAHERSYFRDLAVAQVPGMAARVSNPAGALERLNRHAEEMGVELPQREQARDRRAQMQVERAEREFTGSISRGNGARGFDQSPFERRVNPNRTDGQGGYFVPPLWLVDEYIPALRAGRVVADQVRQMDLPEGTDSINIPKLSTTTLVGMQTGDGVAVPSQDFTDTSVSAGVKTAAGQSDIALQLLEQSPGHIIDQVIIEDLMADYNRLIDRQVVLGSGASGQVTGLLPSSNWANTGTVTWTSASPLGPGFNMVAGAMASSIATNRFSTENVHLFAHPRRWYWFATALDGASGTAGRPLVNQQNVAFNVSAIESGGAAEGYVGHAQFGPHNYYIDANVPAVATAGGAVSGGSNDLAIALKCDDAWLFEGALRTRVLSEVLSGTLQLRYQVFNYIAFLLRYGQSLVVASGTGFAAPASALDSSVTF